jgi:hypothetical protein
MAFDPHNHIAQQRALFGPSNSPYNSNPYASIDSGSFDANFLERITVPLGLSSQDLSREGTRRRRLIDEQNLRFREDIHAMASGAGHFAVAGSVGLATSPFGMIASTAAYMGADYLMEKADVFDREQLAAGHAIRRGFSGRRGAQVFGLNGRMTGEQAFGIAGGFQSMAKSHFSKPVGGVSFNTNDLVQLTSMFNEMGTLGTNGDQSAFFKNIKKKIESFRQIMVDMEMGKYEAMAFNKEIDRMGINNSTQFAAGMGRSVRSVAGAYGMQTQPVMNWYAGGMQSARRTGFAPETSGLFASRMGAALHEALPGFENKQMAFRYGGKEQLHQANMGFFGKVQQSPEFKHFLMGAYDEKSGFNFGRFDDAATADALWARGASHNLTTTQVIGKMTPGQMTTAMRKFFDISRNISVGRFGVAMQRNRRTAGGNIAAEQHGQSVYFGGDPMAAEATFGALYNDTSFNIFKDQMYMSGDGGGYRSISSGDFGDYDFAESSGTMAGKLTFALGTETGASDFIKTGGSVIRSVNSSIAGGRSKQLRRTLGSKIRGDWRDESHENGLDRLTKFASWAGKVVADGKIDFRDVLGGDTSLLRNAGMLAGMKNFSESEQAGMIAGRGLFLMNRSKKFSSLVGQSSELQKQVLDLGKMENPMDVIKGISEIMQALREKAGDGNLGYQTNETVEIISDFKGAMKELTDNLGNAAKAIGAYFGSKKPEPTTVQAK